MNEVNNQHTKFIRYRVDENSNVCRLYFNDGSMTLSFRKCGHLIYNIIEKCRRDNKRYRNDFNDCGDYVEVYYFENKTSQVKAILLDKDFWEEYNEHFFYLSGDPPYAHLFIDGESIRIHRRVVGLPTKYCNIKKEVVDHLNGNTFDNRRENLRIVDHTTNNRSRSFFSENDSGVSGVTLTSDKRKWRVRFARENNIKATVFDSLSDAVEYRYKRGKELGFHFREGSTTIENYIKELRERSE